MVCLLGMELKRWELAMHLTTVMDARQRLSTVHHTAHSFPLSIHGASARCDPLYNNRLGSHRRDAGCMGQAYMLLMRYGTWTIIGGNAGEHIGWGPDTAS